MTSGCAPCSPGPCHDCPASASASCIGVGKCGVVIGGMLITPEVSETLLAFDFPVINTGIDTTGEMAIAIVGVLYVIASIFNLYVPDTGVDHKPLKKNPFYLAHEFKHCLNLLWPWPVPVRAMNRPC